MIQSDSDYNTLKARHKYWRSSMCKDMLLPCQLIGRTKTSNNKGTKKLIAIFLLQMQLLALLLLACSLPRVARASSAQPGHRRLTRSSFLHDQEEEELTIGQQFHRANFGGSSAESPHVPLPVAPERVPSAPPAQLFAARTQKRESELVDPFAFTFEEYLREASGGRASSDGALESNDELQNRISAPNSPTKLMVEDDDNDDSFDAALRRQQSFNTRPSLIIEEDDDSTSNQVESNELHAGSSSSTGGSKLTRPFAHESRPAAADAAVERAQERESQRDAGQAAHIEQGNTSNNNNNNQQDASASPAAQNEIGLLFAWRALPTNKCSKSCGRGQRLNHLSCVDLKYNVRVESELCAQLPAAAKPSELSDELCNELDCEPAWTEIEYTTETTTATTAANCDDGKDNNNANECGRHGRNKVFKKLECAMINGRGQTVRLEESRCQAGSVSNTTAAITTAPEVSTATSTESNDLDEFSIDLNEQLDKERNSILSNEVPVSLLPAEAGPAADERNNHHHHHLHHHKHFRGDGDDDARRPKSNEPFYAPSEWSACTGAPCGMLGKRTRKLTCRLYLSRSAKLVDLPDSSCVANGARALDREEPCYMDCGPSEQQQQQQQQPSYGFAPGPRSSAAVSNEPERRLSNADDDESERTSGRDFSSSVSSSIRETQLEDETIYDLEAARYVWRHGAWTKCSAECLGGVHESVVECWDKVVEASVEQKHCDPLSKPTAPLRRTCNEIPCPPEWRLGPFSECSRPCGSAGVRSRTVACVQQVPLSASYLTSGATYLENLHSSNHHKLQQQHHQLLLVSNELCVERQKQQQQQQQQQQQADAAASNATATSSSSDHSLLLMLMQDHMMPRSIEPCNRRDCRPEWQVGPWSVSDCSNYCGHAGARNRTVICVQEFASRDGPLALEANVSHAIVSPDLREAIQEASASWHPGKSIQVPFSECYREFHSVPQLSERCRAHNCSLSGNYGNNNNNNNDNDGNDDDDDADASDDASTEESFIDSEPLQDFRMLAPDGAHLPSAAAGVHGKRRTITLKIGGRAQVLEGRTLKIRCRIISTKRRRASSHKQVSSWSSWSSWPSSSSSSTQYDLVKNRNNGQHSSATTIEWRKDGVRVFAPNTTTAEKQLVEETDNSILGAQDEDEILLSSRVGGNDDEDVKYSMMLADEPPEAAAKRKQRFAKAAASSKSRDQQATAKAPLAAATTSGASSANSKPRVLNVRSWPTATMVTSDDGSGHHQSFQFVPQLGGRFSLVKENTLRIKKLRLDDSGTYSCSNGLLSETIELTVVSKRARNKPPGATAAAAAAAAAAATSAARSDQQVYNYT